MNGILFLDNAGSAQSLFETEMYIQFLLGDKMYGRKLK